MPKLPKRMYRRGKAYYCRLQSGGNDVRRSLGTNYEEAIDAFRAISRGTRSPEAPRITVMAAIERWIESGVAAARIPSGRRDVASRIRRYAVPLLGHQQLSEVRPDDLLRFRVELERDGLRPTLVHRVLSDVRAFLRWAAFDARLIVEPPIPRRLLPRLQQRFPERLSDEEVARVSSVPEPYGFVVRLALATGLRWGELTRAQASHIRGGTLQVAQTKSGKVRKVPLAGPIVHELRGRVGKLVPFVHPGMFAKQVRRLSGVERFHVHLTRHTYASKWVEAGGNLAVLQAILGHSSILVTQRYAHLSEGAISMEARRVAGQEGTEAGTGAGFLAQVRAVSCSAAIK